MKENEEKEESKPEQDLEEGKSKEASDTQPEGTSTESEFLSFQSGNLSRVWSSPSAPNVGTEFEEQEDIMIVGQTKVTEQNLVPINRASLWDQRHHSHISHYHETPKNSLVSSDSIGSNGVQVQHV
ncbi:hypothetical protein PIB30_044215 [Stylosanthes scabra]|uniref:Uncharacterized protein n=1 Tax=Stylosanthes scabra TaxID=79078 RepID=A0ABU6TFF8_9FABA|nr:hypothetical protein [Stylosanthes scabra]